MSAVQKIKIFPLLITVAMLSFTVRLVDFAAGVSALGGIAFAQTAQTDKPAEKKPEAAEGKISEDKTSAKTPEASKEAAPPSPVNWRDAGDEETADEKLKNGVFDDLAKRRAALDAREKEISTHEALLKAAEQELDRKYQELAQLRTEIEGLLNKQSDEEQARVMSLVKIYEGMKPKEAARIFDTLDLDVLVSVMSKMSERKLSPVMAAMNPDRAKTVTIMLSEEKKLPELPKMGP